MHNKCIHQNPLIKKKYICESGSACDMLKFFQTLNLLVPVQHFFLIHSFMVIFFKKSCITYLPKLKNSMKKSYGFPSVSVSKSTSFP